MNSIFKKPVSILDRYLNEAISVNIEESMECAIYLMKKKRIGSIVITDGNDCVGIITERDILRKCSVKSWSQIKDSMVSEYMTSNPISAPATGTLRDIFGVMIDKNIRHVLLSEEGNDRNRMISIKDFYYLLTFSNIIMPHRLFSMYYSAVLALFTFINRGLGLSSESIFSGSEFNRSIKEIKSKLPKVETCSGPSLVKDVLAKLNHKNFGSLVIKEEEQCELGIFTERDFLLKVLGENMDEALELPISEFMTSPAITVKESDVLGMAIAKMRIGGFRHILVEQEQSSDLLMLSIKDVVQLLLDQAA